MYEFDSTVSSATEIFPRFFSLIFCCKLDTRSSKAKIFSYELVILFTFLSNVSTNLVFSSLIIDVTPSTIFCLFRGSMKDIEKANKLELSKKRPKEKYVFSQGVSNHRKAHLRNNGDLRGIRLRGYRLGLVRKVHRVRLHGFSALRNQGSRKCSSIQEERVGTEPSKKSA